MEDAWNFKDFAFVATSNWLWLLLAFALGLVAGFVACREERAMARR